MEIFFDNFSWMIPNIALASIAVVFGLFYLHSKPVFLQVLFFILWLLFLPNTIYLVTDLEYLPIQWAKVDLLNALILLSQYIILVMVGILSYFVGLMPIEKAFKKLKVKKNKQKFIIITLNFVIAFGVVLGKVERTHSWFILTQPARVYQDVFRVFTSPFLIASIIFFGIIINIIYFGLKNKIESLK